MQVAFIVLAVFGLTYAAPAKNLQDDFQDFLALIPLGEIIEKANWYRDNDAEFKQVIAYLQGDQWAELVATVAGYETWQDLKGWMVDAGFDIDVILEAIHDWIHGGAVGGEMPGRGVGQFFEEVLALIPTDDLLVMLDDKLQNSPSFIAYFEIISSQRGFEFVEEVRHLEEVQRIAGVLIGMGVDVNGIFGTLYGLLGWDY